MYIRKNETVFFIFFLIVFLLTGSFQLAFVQLGAVSDRSGGNASFQIALILSFLVSFFYFNKASGFRIKDYNIIAVTPLLAIVLFCVMSAVWSAEPFVSLRRSLALVLITSVIFFLTSTLKVSQILKIFLYSSFGCSLIACFFSFVPGVGIDSENTMYDSAWRGLTGHKTDLGKIVGLGIVLLFCMFKLREVSFRTISLMLPVMAFVLYKSQSTTSLVLCISCILLIPFFEKNFDPQLNSVVRFFKFVLMVIFTFVFGYLSFYYSVDFLGKDATLTGRTVIWDYALSLYEYKPLLGYGYRNFWVDVNTVDFHFYNPYWGETLMNNGHNGFLDVLLELGAVGFFLYVIFIFSFIWLVSSVKSSDSDSRSFALCGSVLLYFYFIYSVTEQITLDQSDYFWSLLTALYFCGVSKK